MSNKFGFDFLRSDHNLPENHTNNNGNNYNSDDDKLSSFRNTSATTATAAIPNVSHKSDLEKQADVVDFLRHHRSSGCLPPTIIYKSLGIDLSSDGIDHGVSQMLLSNPKINVEEIPDPENPSLSILVYGYRSKFSTVRDKTTLLAQINRCKNGVKMSDLMDAYEGVEKDLRVLLTGGEVLGVMSPEAKDTILFPRGEMFLVELDGCVTVTLPELPSIDNNSSIIADPVQKAVYKAKLDRALKLRKSASHLIQTDIDPRSQIRRGEAIRVGGEWFRVSSAVKEDLPLEEQPKSARAPPSVTMNKDLSQKNEVDGYVRRLDGKTIPLDGALSERGGIENLERARRARERLHLIASGGGVGDGAGGSSSSGGGGGGSAIRSVSGGASATILSHFASEKNPSMLAGAFAKSVAASFGRGGGLGGLAGGRKRPTAMVRRPGEGGVGGAGGARGGANSGALGVEALKRAVENAKQAALDPALAYSHAVRHGCTKDVRQMYKETLELVPKNETDLLKALLDNKLIEPGEKMSRPRMKRKANVDNDGKPKKRRYYERKNMRKTNTHLDGTEIGALLARAAEKQSQGKEVGDGGM